MPKKGAKFVGFARQYCGEQGKVDNCQVGVFIGLGYRKYVIPFDCNLIYRVHVLNTESDVKPPVFRMILSNISSSKTYHFR